MEKDEKRISLKVDLHSGIIELDAPAENFDHAIQKTKELTSSLDLGKRREDVSKDADTERGEEAGRDENRPNPATATPARSDRARSKQGKSSSAARSGRLGSFDPENDLLGEDQQQSIRAFRSSKAPPDLYDEVLVALYEGERLLKRQGFNFNQIYTLMWRAGTSPLPKALDELLRILVQRQLVERNDAGFYLKFMGRERVEKELPKPKE